MNEYISSALCNPATQSISKLAIANYCDCALRAIIDKNNDIRKSGYECAQKNFINSYKYKKNSAPTMRQKN